MSTLTKTKSLYTLPNPEWFNAAGLNKGIGHDRQHLGIILAAGQTVRVRQINTAFTATLRLRLLNDDNRTEAEFSVDNNWVEANINAVSVPFIDTPYVEGEPVVEFEYPDTAKILPVYRKGESENTFFSRWDAQDAEFGFIESDYVNLLIPKISKNTLKSLGEVKNIDGLIAYYDRIFTFYNALTGISFEAERASDLNINNRYFIKADKNGAGAAYYGRNWTAETSNSVSSFWLTPEDSNWGSLHEIAHGYQGHFMGDRYFSTGEVWNNIYAACYQDIMLGERKYKEGWLYDYGNRDKVEGKIIDLIAQSTPLNQWDLRSKLYFIVLMVDKAGQKAFTHFNQRYREKCNTPEFVPSEQLLLDMLSESFTEAGEQIDVTPFIDLAGGYVSQSQREYNMFSHAHAVYPLYQLVSASQLETVKAQLKLESSLSLVDALQLKRCGLKGNVTINFTIDDFAQIYGEDIILMEGARYAYKTQINNPTMELNDLPIGIYTLRLPTGKDQKYRLSSNYLIVKQGENIIDLDFIKKDASSLASQEITLLGLGDAAFAYLTIDRAQSKLIIDVTTTTPHVYYPNVTYAKIIVRDAQNVVYYSNDIQGTQASLTHDEVPFYEDDQIEIYHAEPQRVKVNPAYPNLIDHNNQTNLLTLMPSGLKNVALQGDPEQNLLVTVESAVAQLRNYQQAYYAPFSSFKDEIYLAINAFASPLREQLLVRYQDCLPANNEQPDDSIGNAFTLVGKGFSDRQFLIGVVDLVNKTLTVKINAGIAHQYFPDIYASIAYEDADGNSLYFDEINGRQVQQARSAVLPISGYGGEIIHLRHEEPENRLVVTNEMQQRRLQHTGKYQSYCITTTGLKRITD
ncbi:putative mucin/carbohydrate-binding domain-containing protein [Serratia sp. NPDC078593]|uniref:putative mucin/carbohydrate-binding domain-containing protein n=1 Tax=unclassified Serratia (in: enterobacteria) TaxID=2647522 RepID=UPI0037D85368